MAIRIEVSNKVGVKVAGSIKDEAGAAQPFDFTLICKRMTEDELAERLKGDEKIREFMLEIVEDWKGVKDEEGGSVPFSDIALADLFKIAGMAGLAFNCYLRDVRTKEKN